MSALGTQRLPVEPIKVLEFSRAVRWQRPGVPPTFTVVAAHYAPPGRSANELIIEAAGLAQSRVLLGAVSWSYRRPLVADDQLTGSVALTGCRTTTSRAGLELRIATGETSWAGPSGEPVVTVGVTLIEPAGPAAAGPAVPPPTEPADAAEHAEDAVTISRTDIVRYAGAAGDFNPMHHDAVAARALGYPDVFAMGLLPAGILASRATDGGEPLRALAARFRGLVWPDVAYTVTSRRADDGQQHALALVDPQGTTVLELTATSGAGHDG